MNSRVSFAFLAGLCFVIPLSRFQNPDQVLSSVPSDVMSLPGDTSGAHGNRDSTAPGQAKTPLAGTQAGADSQNTRTRTVRKSPAPEFNGNGLLLSIESLKRSNGVVTIVLYFQNLEKKNYNIWLMGNGATTYLLDEKGGRWDFRDESAGMKSGVVLIPGRKLRCRFTFEGPAGHAGKKFTLIAKFDRTMITPSGNQIDVVIKNIPSE